MNNSYQKILLSFLHIWAKQVCVCVCELKSIFYTYYMRKSVLSFKLPQL